MMEETPKEPIRPYVNIPKDIVRLHWLGIQAKVTFCVLLSYCDHKKLECSVSLATLVSDTNMERKTVQRAIRDLKTFGMLTTPFKPTKSGEGACVYRLKIPPKEAGQKRPSISKYYDGYISGVSKDGNWIEKRIGSKITVKPVLQLPRPEEPPDHKPDCDCGWCAKKDFAASTPMDAEREAVAASGIDF